MTAAQMAQAFRFRLDKTDSLNYPNFENVEIDLLLNQAQERLIKQRYGVTNTKKTSFEETQKRTEDIKNIVDTVTIIPAANAADNINLQSVYCALPTDHYFVVFENCTISYLDCDNNITNDVVPVEAIQHNDYNKIIYNPFKKPNENKVLRLMESGRVELIPAVGKTIVNYKLRYIRKPVQIDSTSIVNVDCELSEHIHDELVDQAVLLALEDIEARRQQTYVGVDKTNE